MGQVIDETQNQEQNDPVQDDPNNKVINQTETDTNRPFVGYVETAPVQQAGLSVSQDNSSTPQTYNPQASTSTATTPDLQVTQVAGATDQKALSFTETQLAGEIDAKPEPTENSKVIPTLLLLLVIIGAIAALIYMQKSKKSKEAKDLKKEN